MMAFMEGAVDVLVTTTIIESGIDIPNANTLIVNDAESFGLADLYQLRGRVGRFDRKAYAYLVVARSTALTPEARKRLEAMAEHTALGSGFNIAMEDLKIRGAGNLLGVEQSGHVSAIGFDLYCRLLREAVARLREGEASMPPADRVRELVMETR
ncbi:MAG: transcription-repair coupling factor, partial [Candidatus Omnitrophica bacterium]|nr:transcription-repair coupling factor [Candidatus Omnitrophota bacterium]